MNQEEADEVLRRAESLANDIGKRLMEEDNFAVAYLAVCLVSDTLDMAVPESIASDLKVMVKMLNESMIMQKEKGMR